MIKTRAQLQIEIENMQKVLNQNAKKIADEREEIEFLTALNALLRCEISKTKRELEGMRDA